MKSFVHIHSSGRFDISGARLYPAAERYNKNADLVTYTEAQYASRREAIKRANGSEFGIVLGEHRVHNDCVISYKRSRFKLIHKESTKAANLRYFTKHGFTTSPVYATIAILKDIATDSVYVVSVVHLPAHVETDIYKKHRTSRVISWYTGFRNVKRRCNALKKHYHANGVLFIADWNINFKKAWARSLVKVLAPSYRLNWTSHGLSVPGGTHGFRIIDATIRRGNLHSTGAHLFEDDSSSDHRPYEETFR